MPQNRARGGEIVLNGMEKGRKEKNKSGGTCGPGAREIALYTMGKTAEKQEGERKA